MPLASLLRLNFSPIKSFLIELTREIFKWQCLTKKALDATRFLGPGESPGCLMASPAAS